MSTCPRPYRDLLTLSCRKLTRDGLGGTIGTGSSSLGNFRPRLARVLLVKYDNEAFVICDNDIEPPNSQISQGQQSNSFSAAPLSKKADSLANSDPDSLTTHMVGGMHKVGTPKTRGFPTEAAQITHVW